MTGQVLVAGVGMTAFERPGRPSRHEPGWDYPDMVREAGQAALLDAGVTISDIEAAVASYVYGDSCAGQRAIYELGETGMPIYNVNNNCSSVSTALMLARQLIAGGQADCMLAVGFEKMQPGSISEHWTDRAQPLARHQAAIERRYPSRGGPIALEQFGNAGREHMERYGTRPEHFAMVAEKNHRHSVHNENAQFRAEYSLADVLASTEVFAPLTKLQCSPTSDGAAAVVLMSARMARARGLEGRAVRIVEQEMVTDFPSSFDGRSAIATVGAEMSRTAALRVYERSGIGPEDLDVIELHGCFSTNEIITYESLGLCAEGRGGPLVESGATTYGGDCVVNPSGGLISKGHPLGATGLAQCAELTRQLRGECGLRQVAGARRALQHNIGVGGAAVVTLYEGPARTGEEVA